jgi:hypothetical protein
MIFFIISFLACLLIPITIFAGELEFNLQTINYILVSLGLTFVFGFVLIYTDDYYYADLDTRDFHKCTSFFKTKLDKRLFTFDQILCISVSGKEHTEHKRHGPSRRYWMFTPLLFTSTGLTITLGKGGEELFKQNEHAEFLAQTLEVPFTRGEPGRKAVLEKSGPARYRVCLKKPSLTDKFRINLF